MRTYRVIESIEDQMRDVVTVESYPSDGSRGSRICFSGQAVKALGLVGCLKRVGFELPSERVPVRQYGRIIGTVPGDFEPMDIRSSSIFYEPRSDDFKWEGDEWLAAKNLGPGDFEAIRGFVWERDSDTHRQAETVEQGSVQSMGSAGPKDIAQGPSQ